MKNMQDKHIDEMKDTMKQTSKFAWARGEGRCPENLYYNEPIMETSEFLVVPSLGSIVPGWLLIVPKVDVARFSELPRQSLEKLETLLETLKAETENTFGRAYLFEHGGHVGSKLSCGVDQAHLHLVPLAFDLLEAAVGTSDLKWTIKEGLIFTDGGFGNDEYLFVSSFDKTAACRCPKPVSQWFRRLIAKKMNVAEAWNYREYPFHENILRTLEATGAHGY